MYVCVRVCTEISEDMLGDEDDLPWAVTDHTLNCSLSVSFILSPFFSLFQICVLTLLHLSGAECDRR